MTEIVVLDACVLVPYNLTSLLLAFAEHDLFEPRWSDHILEEVERTLVEKMGRPAVKVGRRLDAMRSAFPEATVCGYERLESGLECDPKDRHVLAAAIAGGATTIVTTNLKDFPSESCAPYDIAARHPDSSLSGLLKDSATSCADAIKKDAARTRRPPLTPRALLAGVTGIAPTFANAMHQTILDGAPATSDVPAYVAAPIEETPLHELSRRYDPSNPLHVACLWWTALMERSEYRTVLHDLTHSPGAFGDYEWAAELLAPFSLASRVWYAVDDPDHVAFVRFVPEVAQTSRTFAAFTVRTGAYLTLRKYPDDTWRVWGLGNAMVSARDVLNPSS